MSKLVSIAIATYNGEQFLRKQLDSIFAQTYKNIEIVAVDDCSTDGTVEILKIYKQQYGLQFYVNKKNIGFVKNFERAILLCKGEYIALCDQDDIWLPNKIEVMVNEIEDYSMIYSDAIIIDGNENIITKSKHRFYCIDEYTGMPIEKFLLRNYVTGCTSMINRKLIEGNFEIPIKVSHDWWLAVLACNANGIKYLDQQMVKYRIHNNNQIGIKNIKFYTKIKTLLSIEDCVVEALIEKKMFLAKKEMIETFFLFNEKTILFRIIIFFKYRKIFFTKNIYNYFRYKLINA